MQTRARSRGLIGPQPQPQQGLRSSSGDIYSLSAYDFMKQIGLAPFFHHLGGSSCEDLVKLTGNEFQLKFYQMPIREAEKLRAGVEELRQCFALASETQSKEMPGLRAYLVEQGMDSFVINKLEDRGVDMKKFLELSAMEMYAFVDWRNDLRDKLLECKRNLLEMKKNNWAKPGKIIRVVDNTDFDELKTFLEHVDLGKHIKLFSGMSLAQVKSLSRQQLMQLGMPELEAKFFMIKMDSFRVEKNSGLGHDAVNTAGRKSSEISNIGIGLGVRGEQSSNSGGSTSTITTQVQVLSAKAFLDRHEIVVLRQDIPEPLPAYAADLENMNETELRKLVLMLLDSYKSVLGDVAVWQNQMQKMVESANAEPMDLDATETMAPAHPTGNLVQGAACDATPPPTPETDSASHSQDKADSFNSPRDAINILLLGPTGIGKSTVINSLANHLHYDTLREALNKKMVVLIPASFSQCDANYVSHRVTIQPDREDKNRNECIEEDQIGQSSTQGCRSYLFISKAGAIRFIDTPGVNDVRGIEQDALNFDNILSFVAQYPDLHGICILLHPNNTRNTAGFRLCINGLLKNLEKSASRNIIFVFTNARSTNFCIGETYPILEGALAEIASQPPYVQIPFNTSTSFLVENDGFRFLAAIKSGLHFKESYFADYASSWSSSAGEYRRLVQHILTLEPHKVRDTVSISEARRLIDELGSPVADILMEITTNTGRIREQREFLEKNRNSKESLESLKGKLLTKVIEVDYKTLRNPRTVCASKKCITISNGEVTYTKICHDQCKLYFNSKMSGIPGDSMLKSCEAFNWSNNYSCSKCGCSWKEHVRIQQEKVFRESLREDLEVKALLNNAKTMDEVIKAVGGNLGIYKVTRRTLVNTMAFFAAYQNANCITGRGDYFRDCLEYHLKMENYKNSAGIKNQGIISDLQIIIRKYDGAKQKFDRVGDGDKDNNSLTAENVFEREKALYALTLHGSRLRQLREKIQQGRVKDAVSSETVVNLMNKDGEEAATGILQPIDSFFTRN